MSENLPLVSIVLCAYNGGQFIAEQLKSLEEQTYPNIEFICSDNNSTDGTAAILGTWCRSRPKATFILQKNKGLNSNFFYAADKATGRYIIFCDQDDIWLPTKVAELVAFHQRHPTAGMVYCLSKSFTKHLPQNLFNTGDIKRIEGSNIRQTMLISFTLGHNICIRKEVYDKLPKTSSEIVAYDWWITVGAMLCGGIKCLKKNLTYWRRHEESTTDEMNKGLFWQQRIGYLRVFLMHPLLSAEDRQWIENAIAAFQDIKGKPFSFKLFGFLLSNAKTIFFYKTKTTTFSLWFSYIKWSAKMSRNDYRV